mmetsp:Transcript_23929/g.55237  ORF Transcript_23929/g.55237 Transcript_23929/m.55237 type:complete len:194 (+) Transcript_23929:70-651(+)
MPRIFLDGHVPANDLHCVSLHSTPHPTTRVASFLGEVDSRAVRLREQDLSALVAGVTSPSRQVASAFLGDIPTKRTLLAGSHATHGVLCHDRLALPTSLAAAAAPHAATPEGEAHAQASTQPVVPPAGHHSPHAAQEGAQDKEAEESFHWLRGMSGLTVIFNEVALLLTFVSAAFHLIAFRHWKHTKQQMEQG